MYCSGDEDDRCYHTASEDSSAWNSPSLIHAGCPDCDARVAVDARGRIHAVLGSQATKGTVMYYSRSEDGGLTWADAIVLDRPSDRFSVDYGPGLGHCRDAGPGPGARDLVRRALWATVASLVQ